MNATNKVEYFDSSAIAKIVLDEPESSALRRYLPNAYPIVSSTLARVEVIRAIVRLGDEEMVEKARDVLRDMELIKMGYDILKVASTIKPRELRSLDAIHLATASTLGGTLARFVVYDKRLAQAAEAQGWEVRAPR